MVSLLTLSVSISQVNAAPVYFTGVEQPTFSDIPPDHWANEAATRLLGSGFLEGNKGDKFRGDDFMTRYEFALAMARVVYATICVLPPPPDETVYAKKSELSEVLKRLNAIETRLQKIEERVDLKKVTSANEQTTQKEIMSLKNDVVDVTKQLAQQIKTQTP